MRHFEHPYCILHTVHCTLHTAHCILHTAYCTRHTAQLTWFSITSGSLLSRKLFAKVPVTLAPTLPVLTSPVWLPLQFTSPSKCKSPLRARCFWFYYGFNNPGLQRAAEVSSVSPCGVKLPKTVCNNVTVRRKKGVKVNICCFLKVTVYMCITNLLHTWDCLENSWHTWMYILLHLIMFISVVPCSGSLGCTKTSWSGLHLTTSSRKYRSCFPHSCGFSHYPAL